MPLEPIPWQSLLHRCVIAVALIPAMAFAQGEPEVTPRPAVARPATEVAEVPPVAKKPVDVAANATNLRDARAAMGKWIETQQIISKETRDWNQNKEILASRIEVVKQESIALESKIKLAEAQASESAQKKSELLTENEKLKEQAQNLASTINLMERDVQRILRRAPEFIQARLKPLAERIPADPATTKVSIAERFQNVLGILNDLNKANNETTVNFEVRNLSDGKPSEVRVLYIGLAQAYYLSAQDEAGIGRPGPDGWVWEPANAIADRIRLALDVIASKQKPAFVALPVKIL
jgi:hypothetical protein